MPWTTPSMTPLTQADCTATIAAHSAALAGLAEGHLDAEVEFCPGWTVRDLVHHVTEVHWFWATIVADRITERPTHLEHPERATDDDTVAAFRAATDRLVRVLSDVDPATRVWTWAPHRQDAGFVIRHQVQEIVVHHWDAAHAAGRTVEVSPEVGADCVDEMLQFSVVNADNVDDDPLPPALDGTFALCCNDSEAAWLVTDGDQPGISAVTRATAAEVAERGLPAVTGTGGQLIQWLYDRHGDPAESGGDADPSAVDAADPELLARFRKLCFTD
ncbi:MAG: maleylpyruvate isomerase family mycothiol-dependent enzyme [Lapillicoccus sp.]